MTTLYRKDLGAPEDFTESRSIVCMIDRVCCVMYRCNYELLISPYNLFHPTITNTLQPGRLLMFETHMEVTEAENWHRTAHWALKRGIPMGG